MWPWLKQRVRGRSVIGPHVCIRGNIESAGDLTICGCVKGDIMHNGHLELAGVVEGNVQVEGTLVLQSTAWLLGDTRCSSLEVKPGAVFTGTNRMEDAPVAGTPAAMAVVSGTSVGLEEKEALGVAFSPAIR